MDTALCMPFAEREEDTNSDKMKAEGHERRREEVLWHFEARRHHFLLVWKLLELLSFIEESKSTGRI